MALSVATMATELQAELGKASDDTLITTTRCVRWLNQAQNDIIDAWPHLRDVGVRDKTTWRARTNQYEYDVRDLPAHRPLAHVKAITIINTTTSDYTRVEPYPGGLSMMDEDIPYIPATSAGCPAKYALRDYTLTFWPMFSSAYEGMSIWVDYAFRPADMATTDTATILRFDEILIQWAKSYAYNAMAGFESAGGEQRAYAAALAQERVDGEDDYDFADIIQPDGPY